MVKLSMCLIKHHTMKTGRGNTVSHVLNCKQVMEVSSHPNLHFQLHRKLGRSQSWSGQRTGEKSALAGT